jgi:hypothetical protein
MVVSVDWLGVGCWTDWPKFASDTEQGFDGFVSESEERAHRLETGG